MKRWITFLTVAAVVLCLSGIPLFAQHGGGGQAGRGGMRGAGGPKSDMGKRTSGTNRGKGTSTPGTKTPGDLLTQNTKLASKLQSLLPAGTDLQGAAAGFKNLGQFVAAIHVSNNLGIPFDQLKEKMVGGESLGKAIQVLKPDVDAKAEAKKAQKQAKQDIRESESGS